MRPRSPRPPAPQDLCTLPRYIHDELLRLKQRVSPASRAPARILVADDREYDRELLSDYLEMLGHTVVAAGNGTEALAQARTGEFDLVLLDIVMPEMSGYGVLEALKTDPGLRPIPVIITSGTDDWESITACVEAGADDYLLKPINLVFLKARVSASLETYRLREIENAYREQLEVTQLLATQLLTNTFPEPIALRLMNGERIIAEYSDDVTVLFADIVDFTKLAARMHPGRLVNLLNSVFNGFDALAEQYGIEKIKTVGDRYMATAGVPSPRADGAEAMAEMALRMQEEIPRFRDDEGNPLKIRIGINNGPVVSGIIGSNKLSYDLWGDTVNIASRMESEGIPGRVQVSRAAYERLNGKYLFESRGEIELKGRGRIAAYLLKGKRE